MRIIIIILMFIVLCSFLVSCDGSHEKGEQEFTVFDVTIRVLEIDSQIGPADCIETAAQL